MQWADAKRWFSSGSDGVGIYYLLKMEHRDKTPTEIYNELKRYYDENYINGHSADGNDNHYRAMRQRPLHLSSDIHR